MGNGHGQTTQHGDTLDGAITVPLMQEIGLEIVLTSGRDGGTVIPLVMTHMNTFAKKQIP